MPVQLGDLFTLSFLRVCGAECMFLLAYDYLYEIGYHKSFCGNLFDKQNEEDLAERTKYVDRVTEEALRIMREDLQANPKLLSTPVPEGILKIFEEVTPIPQCSGQTMKFTRPSKEEKIRWQTARVDRLKNDLSGALEELRGLESE